MVSRSSIASAELRAVGVEGSEATLVNQEKGDPQGLAPLPLAVAAKDTPEEDPFMVKLSQDDPSHSNVCVTYHFPMAGPGPLTFWVTPT